MLPIGITSRSMRQQEARLVYRHAKACEVLRASRLLLLRMRHTARKGVYEIPPEVVVRLASAVDDVPAVEMVEEGGQGWD